MYLHFFYEVITMKKAKLYLAKKILCFLLVGCITSTSIFLSYGNTLVVYADDSSIDNIIRSVVSAVMIVVGVGGAITTGGVTVGHVVSALMGLWAEYDNITDYIIDNGDGTYTVKDELVQAVLQAIQDVENSTFDSTDIESMWNGLMYEYSYNWHINCRNTDSNNIVDLFCSSSEFLDTPIAGYLYNSNFSSLDDDEQIYKWTQQSLGWYYYSASVIDSHSIRYNRTVYENCVYSSLTTGYGPISSCTLYDNIYSVAPTMTNTEFLSYHYGFNFPIFATYEEMQDYFESGGDGYENALNYNQEFFEYSSKYDGTYSGGDFRVLASTLSGLDAKITDVNSRLDDIDEQVKELQEYLNEIKEESGEDEETEGSSWLEKIYNTLVKIYKKICSIRRWVIADTVIDGADLLFDILTEIGEMVVDLIVEPAVAFAYLASEISTLGSFLSKKFPFCIPWDVAFLLDFLKAEPKTPEFTLPLKIETYGIDEEIKISLEQFEIVSKISRIFLTLVFCRGLLDLSMKVVTVKQKEG